MKEKNNDVEKLKNVSIMDSFNNAINGIVDSVNSERNMKVHLVLSVLILAISILLDFTRVELILITITIILVLAFELINTSVEALADFVVGDQYSEGIKKVKDISAGAVMLTSVNAVFVAYLIIYPKLKSLLVTQKNVLEKVMVNQEHLVIISIGLVLVLTLLLKGIFYKNNTTHLQGGTVSGHSSVAFNIATIGTILTKNTTVAILFFAIATLVAQSRLEAKFHVAKETIFGAILGIVIALLLFYRFI